MKLTTKLEYFLDGACGFRI